VALALLLTAVPVAAQLGFVDVGPAVGIDEDSYGRGCAMGDLDGDGLLDLFAANGAGPDTVYRQLPDHTFEEVSDLWGFPNENLQSWDVLIADFDNDSDNDVYVVTGGFNLEHPNRMFRNDLDTLGVFTDVTAQAGDAELVAVSFGATALDYDRDGDLDVFVCDNWRVDDFGGCHLLRNDGGLVFTDVSVESGVRVPGDFRHCSAGDYDNDGWVDVGVGGLYVPSILFRNNGDGTFTDVSVAAGIDITTKAYGMVLEDLDNDGWLDVFLPIYQSGVITDTTGLYMNNHDGTFTDVSDASGIGGQQDMGHNAGDLDGDGYPELYIGTGSPPSPTVDMVYRILPDGFGGVTATDITASTGIDLLPPTRTHGTAFGDYDEDGDVDVYLNTGGMSDSATSHEINRLLQNQGNGNNWLKVSLTGVLSSRTPAGARLHAVTTTGRGVHRQLTVGKGFGNTDSAIQHFGLGTDGGVQKVFITWPSGITQTLLGPAISSTHEVTETGLRLDGVPTVGGSFQIEACGPAGHQMSWLVGEGTVDLPKPKYGGSFLVTDLILPPIELALDAAGRLTVPVTLPGNPVISGLTLYLQSWTRAPGATEGGVLTNRVTIAIQ
jgi:hypothetical protein